MDPVQRGLGVPVVLLSAVWGSFGLVLKVFELLNERRDKFMECENAEHAAMILWNDWLPLWLGTCAFMLTVAGILLAIPRFFAGSSQISDGLKSKTRRLCLAVAALQAIAAAGFIFGGYSDFEVMLSRSSGGGPAPADVSP